MWTSFREAGGLIAFPGFGLQEQFGETEKDNKDDKDVRDGEVGCWSAFTAEGEVAGPGDAGAEWTEYAPGDSP